ncbi:MAG: sugar phosphate nucleotidyltransferase [candidate division KSB1 bacterium]|nr:sugar phosphate nucleotidyltransferase [candidate division KSB1 bacterium]
MQAVILCAGKSTRTYPLTLSRPKPLLPLVNMTLLEWNLTELSDVVDEVILVVGYRQEMIREKIGETFGPLRVRYCEQREQLGTGHAVLQARDLLRGPFLVLNGDDVYSAADFRRLAQLEAAALVLEVSNPSLYGVYEVDAQGRVLSLEEKPASPKGNLANLGCYKFPLEIIQYLQSTGFSVRNEIEITSAIAAIAREKEFYTVRRHGRWLPTGFAWDLLTNSEAIWSEGAVPARVVHPTCRIAPSAELVEPVFLGPNCEIGPHAVVGPYSALISAVAVGPGSVVSHSILFEQTSVDADVVLTASVVAEGSRLGASVRAFAEVDGSSEIVSEIKGKMIATGRRRLGCIIGAGTTVGPGTWLWPGVKVWPGMQIPAGARLQADVRPADFRWS